MASLLKNLSVFVLAMVIAPAAVSAFQTAEGESPSQEMSEKEGIPVLIKHLPGWENKRDTAIFTNDRDDLLTYLDDREVLQRLEFIPGTEAVIASYPEGKLLIIEFTTPQASSDADARVRQFLENSGGGQDFHYRRIGNYNVFLFDGRDEAAAAALFDQIKYEKVVQWLGRNPNLIAGLQAESERNFIVGASSLFISTVIVIVTGLGSSVIFGVIVGLLFFYYRDQRRSSMSAFSDAGGMTRLNLDGLSAEPDIGKLLKK